MTLKSRAIIKTSLLLAIIGAFAASTAMAEEYVAGSDQNVEITTPEPAPAAVPEKKKSTQREPKPGEKLTYKQLSEILSSSRNLAGRNLSGLNLVGVDLSFSSLQGADMRNTNLERANMMGADLERADLTGANLKMASFYQSAITAAKLDNAVLDGAIWIDKSVCAKGSTGECLKKEKKPAQPAQAEATAKPAETAKAAEVKQ
jgi:Pentapeptide repeats (8 copies)